MIILCISQNATALLKKFRVIFRHLELFFVLKSALQDYKQEASWKAHVLGLLWMASTSQRAGEGLSQPWSPSRAMAWVWGMAMLLAPGFGGGTGMTPWSTKAFYFVKNVERFESGPDP